MSTFYRLYFRKELICELCEYRSKWSNSTSQRNHLKTFHNVTKPLKKTFECYICYLKATSIEGCPKPVLFYSDEGMNYSLFYYLCPTSYFLHQIKIVFKRKLSWIKNHLLLDKRLRREISFFSNQLHCFDQNILGFSLINAWRHSFKK